MYSLGTGSDMMKRIAAPMIGGVFTSFIMELFVYPPHLRHLEVAL
jgi:Cu(I)/Ag(I) efflux system membrane protein CusA/SilA